MVATQKRRRRTGRPTRPPRRGEIETDRGGSAPGGPTVIGRPRRPARRRAHGRARRWDRTCVRVGWRRARETIGVASSEVDEGAGPGPPSRATCRSGDARRRRSGTLGSRPPRRRPRILPSRPTKGAAPRAPRSPDSVAEGHRRSRRSHAPGGSEKRHLPSGSSRMAPTSPDPVDSLVDHLVHRHHITPRDALVLLRRAARRKGVSLDVLAARVPCAPTPTTAG